MSLMPMENGGLLGGGGGWETGLLGQNPLLNIGLGILANNTGNYGRAGPAIGRGAAQGMQQTQQALAQAAAQKMMKAQMEEMEEERKRRRGTTEALSKAYSPAGNVANMSFMDANNEVMAGGNPDFQVNPTEASFDINRALPEIMQVNPELGMQLYQQEQERQRQAQFQQQMQGVIGGGGADWQQQAQMGALGAMTGMKGASSLIELAKLNKPDPSVDLAAAKYFDETGQYPPGYVPPQARGQQPTQPQAGNLPTNNFGMPISWSGADFGAPGTTQTDIAEGVRSDADVALLDPRKGRPVTGPLVTPMPAGLSPAQQRQFRLDEAKAQIQTPTQKLEAEAKTKELQSAERKKEAALASAEESIQLIDEMIGNPEKGIPEHPGFRQAVGKSSMLGAQKIPGTESYAFMTRLNQMRGKQFLEAFETLKGGGQITQIEGEKATQAIARMDNASTEEEFIKASRDFQEIIKKGRDRLLQNAGTQPQPSGKKPPMKGQIKNGWKFMGGDPADPNSWRKQ